MLTCLRMAQGTDLLTPERQRRTPDQNFLATLLFKRAFDAIGIRFALPTVQVAGGGKMASVVAHEGLHLVESAGAAE